MAPPKPSPPKPSPPKPSPPKAPATRLPSLEQYVANAIKINLSNWSIQAYNALNQAHLPKDPDSELSWFVALAGNLLWAAVCLLDPPEAVALAAVEAVGGFFKGDVPKVTEELMKSVASSRKTVIATMSFGGGALASGIPNRGMDGLNEGQCKKLIGHLIGSKQARLEEIYRPIIAPCAKVLNEIWAAAGNADQPFKEYDEYLWIQMFPRVKYDDDDRYNNIGDYLLNKIETMLADFDRQYRDWSIARMMPQPNRAYALYAMGTLAVVPETFTPKLNVSLD